MSWSEREVSLWKAMGRDPPPPFNVPVADWFAEFVMSRLWLETSMPDRAAEDVYVDAWIEYQNPPTRLWDFGYSYPHYSLFRELASLSSVRTIWPHPSRRVLGALLGAETEMILGLQSELYSFMIYHERQIELIQVIEGYCELLDEIQQNGI